MDIFRAIVMFHSTVMIPTLSFFRACEEESKARMGVVECLNHNLVESFSVLYEKDSELDFIAFITSDGCIVRSSLI